MKKYWCFSGVLVTCLVYILLRLGWRDTIEFGYDQPILASSVLGFLKQPTFLDSYRFVNVNPWGYPSWGPVQIFFFSAFLSLSRNPITVSCLVATFNLISILLIVYVGWKFFSPAAGIVGGIFLALHPWWIIFSRMIYEPTPVPTFIGASMLLSLWVYKNPKSWLVCPLVFSWAVLFQFYVHTFSFIVVSVILLLLSLKKLNRWYLILGGIFSFAFNIPVFKYYLENLRNALDFIKVGEKFSEWSRGFSQLTFDVVTNFIKVLSGGALKWQLGYAYQEFYSANRLLPLFLTSTTCFLLAVIIYTFARIMRSPSRRTERLLLLGWILSPVWFLIITKSPSSLPRYFLQSLPPLCLLVGLSVAEWIGSLSKNNLLLRLAALFVILLLPIYWGLLIIRYYQFIEGYSYPSGFLSNYSDVPYVFLERSFDWILADAANKGYTGFTISTDPSHPWRNVPSWAVNYTWSSVYDKKGQFSNGNRLGHYLLVFTPVRSETGNYRQFGPYLVFDYVTEYLPLTD
jgi:hypothetical protein